MAGPASSANRTASRTASRAISCAASCAAFRTATARVQTLAVASGAQAEAVQLSHTLVISGISDSDLARAAEELHHLPRSVPECLLWRDPELDHALRRWLSLVPPPLSLVPPPDVDWVWMVHMLCPEK